jgi:periodic tryptophan protein 2
MSPDGSLLLAAGESKYICLYDLERRILLRKIVFTENRSLGGVLKKLNSRDVGRRRESTKVRATGLLFNGLSYYLITPEGVLEFTHEDRFLPVNLSAGVSYKTIIAAMCAKRYIEAFSGAAAMNEEGLVRDLLYRTPVSAIQTVANGLRSYDLLAKVLAHELANSHEFGVLLKWVHALP